MAGGFLAFFLMNINTAFGCLQITTGNMQDILATLFFFKCIYCVYAQSDVYVRYEAAYVCARFHSLGVLMKLLLPHYKQACSNNNNNNNKIKQIFTFVWRGKWRQLQSQQQQQQQHILEMKLFFQ